MSLLLAATLAASGASALTMVVDSTADAADALPGDARCDDGSGRCTLRAALDEAAANLGHELITFDIVGDGGVQTIRLTAALPDISEHTGVTIDGTTQFGYASSPLIEIDGSAVAGDCLVVSAGHSNIYALNIHSCGGSALVFSRTHLMAVRGCFLGTDPTGTIAKGNGAHGLHILESSDNQIGGATPGQGNLFSGNGGDGILVEGLDSFANAMRGNDIGIDASGTLALGNGRNGVTFDLANSNTLGGPNPGDRNIISGNRANGVALLGDGASVNLVQGNAIGTDRALRVALGNDRGIRIDGAARNRLLDNIVAGSNTDGVLIAGMTSLGTELFGNMIGGRTALANGGDGVSVTSADGGVTIGGTVSGQANTIAANRGTGVRVTSGDDNAIRGNSIFGNARLGIDLGVDAAVTLNDQLDADSGANGLQNFPVLSSVVSTCIDTTAIGRLDATASASHEIDFFASDGCSSSGHGQAMRYLGSAPLLTDASGAASFNVVLPVVVAAGVEITATATRVSAAGGATSELSVCRTATQTCFTCGDRVADPGEECDDGGINTSACDADCSFARCGDGHVNRAANEECDDGNTVDSDGCDARCALETCATGTLVRLERLRVVALAPDRVELSWEDDPAALVYHLNSTTAKAELLDPTRSPGNGLGECDVTPPATRCEVTTTAAMVFFQVLSACGPAGFDEGPF